MATLTFTPAAAAQLKRVYEEQALSENVYLILGVRGGGCSGFQYTLNMAETAEPGKYVTGESNGIKYAVDKRSALYVNGTTVDFKDDLNKRGFEFRNPTSKGTCGCGSSFAV